MSTYFKENLFLAHFFDGLDESELGLEIWSLIDKFHAQLDHFNESLLGVTSFVGQQSDELVQLIPFFSVKSDLHL